MDNNVNNNTSFDILDYVSHYSGHTKSSRLNFLLQQPQPPPQQQQLLHALLIHLKEGVDVSAYVSLYRKAALAEDLHALSIPYDEAWVQATERKVQQRMERLETDLANARSAMVKESIRLSLVEIGQLHRQTGNLNEAVKSFSKAREVCSTPKQLQDLCVHLTSVCIDAEQFFSAHSHLSKIGEVDNNNHDLLMQLRCYSALVSLHDKQYRIAALKFLEISGNDNLPSSLMTLEDVAVYGSLLSLSSLDRTELRSLVTDRRHFLNSVLSQSPLARDLAMNFLDGKGGDCLRSLELLRSRVNADLHLHRHAEVLSRLVVERVLQQYCRPYNNIRLSRMQSSLNMDQTLLLETVCRLVGEGRLSDLRVDCERQLLVRVNDGKCLEGKGLGRVVRVGERQRRNATRDLLRLSLLEHGLSVDKDKDKDKEEVEEEEDREEGEDEFDGVGYLSSHIQGGVV